MTRLLIEYSERGQLLVEALGCPTADLACLQALSSDDIITAQNSVNVSGFVVPGHSQSYTWSPYVDNVELVDTVAVLCLYHHA